jgi:hypothetical protein
LMGLPNEPASRARKWRRRQRARKGSGGAVSRRQGPNCTGEGALGHLALWHWHCRTQLSWASPSLHPAAWA